MPDDEVYERLIGRLRSWLFDLPDSELLMPILKLRFSYEEVEFLSGAFHSSLPHWTSSPSAWISLRNNSFTRCSP